MAVVFAAAWALLVVGLLSWAFAWARSKNTKVRAAITTLIALAWVVFRATTGLQAVLIRPLGVGWIILFALLVAGVVTLVIVKRSRLASLLASASLVLAVLLPGFDLLGSAWSAWLAGDWVNKALSVATIVIAAFLVWKIAKTKLAASGLLVVALVMILVWAQAAFTGSSPVTAPATPSATATSATPSSSPSSTEVPVTTTQQGQIVGWDNLVESTNNATEWQELVNTNQSQLGWGWGDAQQWASWKTSSGKLVDARVVVVFADLSAISDTRARELAGVVGSVPIVRASSSCYTPVGQTEVCPTGDESVIAVLSPLKGKDGNPSLGTGSGVALIPQSDEVVALIPVTYRT